MALKITPPQERLSISRHQKDSETEKPTKQGREQPESIQHEATKQTTTKQPTDPVYLEAVITHSPETASQQEAFTAPSLTGLGILAIIFAFFVIRFTQKSQKSRITETKQNHFISRNPKRKT